MNRATSRRLDRAAAASPQRRLFSACQLRHGRGLRSTLARPSIRGFAFVGRGGPLLLLLLFKAMLLGRAGKSGRPAPLEPSLKVYRDIAHTKAPGLLSAPRGQRHQRARALKGPSKMAARGSSVGAPCDGLGTRSANPGPTSGLPRVVARLSEPGRFPPGVP